MEILKTSFSCEKMVKVPSGVKCCFSTNQILNFFLWITVKVDEVGKETKHGRLLLSFFRKTIDQLDYFLDEWVEIISQ